MDRTKIYTWGGAVVGGGPAGDWVTEVFDGGWEIDVQAKTVTPLPSGPGKRMRASAAIADAGGTLLLYGGFTTTDVHSTTSAVHTYNPRDHTWMEIYPSGKSHGSWGHSSIVALPSNTEPEFLLFGGWAGGKTFSNAVTHLARKSDTWSWGAHVERPFGDGKSGMAVGLVRSREVMLMFGGSNSTGVRDPGVFAYKYRAQAWSTQANVLPTTDSTGNGLSVGVIAGIAVVCILIVSAIIGAVLYCHLAKRGKLPTPFQKKAQPDEIHVNTSGLTPYSPTHQPASANHALQQYDPPSPTTDYINETRFSAQSGSLFSAPPRSDRQSFLSGNSSSDAATLQQQSVYAYPLAPFAQADQHLRRTTSLRSLEGVETGKAAPRLGQLLAIPHGVVMKYEPQHDDEIGLDVGDAVRVKIAYDDG
ncbi:hypothetical protein HDV00_010062 [Rhizophlyctis rosea]|nr:hypothetical protein HDV00_010062 [Rhizophlyctis rosea]